MSQKYVDRVNAFMEPYLKKNGYSLIRSEFTEEDHNWYLRLYIDLTEEEIEKRAAAMAEEAEDTERQEAGDDAAAAGLSETGAEPEEIPEESEEDDGEETPVPGVSINDCAKVSRYLSKWLDKEDFIRETYMLEVCSRGFLPGES